MTRTPDMIPAGYSDFEGRSFEMLRVADGRGGTRTVWACDRTHACLRVYESVIDAARCANPNHSHITGPVERRATKDLAARATGGVRLGGADTRADDAPAVNATAAKEAASRPGRPPRTLAPDEEAAVKRALVKAAVTPHPENAGTKQAPGSGKAGSGKAAWTPERRARHSEIMKASRAQKAAQEATPDAPRGSKAPDAAPPSASKKPGGSNGKPVAPITGKGDPNTLRDMTLPGRRTAGGTMFRAERPYDRAIELLEAEAALALERISAATEQYDRIMDAIATMRRLSSPAGVAQK